MTDIDPNLLFFGNWVDASSRIEDIEKFLEQTSSAYQRELNWLEEEGHVDLDIEFVPLFAETLPPILYTSVVIAAASVLEQELRGICQALREALKIPLSFNDMVLLHFPWTEPRGGGGTERGSEPAGQGRGRGGSGRVSSR